jgi:hypothetical protein
MEGLIVRQPHATMIIHRRKRWELRSRKPPKNKCNKNIYLLSEGKVLGVISITMSRGPPTYRRREKGSVKHPCFAWMVSVKERYEHPVRYLHPRGARVWVRHVTKIGRHGNFAKQSNDKLNGSRAR